MDKHISVSGHPGMDTNLRRFLGATEKWPSFAAKEWVEQFAQMAYDQADIKAVVVFGSIARDVNFSADVDLLLVYEYEKPTFIMPPLDVDVRVYREADIDTLIVEGHELLCWSIRFGKALHEKNRYWTNVRKKWMGKLSLPSAETADKRAERARRLFEDLREIGDEDAAQEQLITMLTHLARARLIRAGVYPASRPELPEQLRSIGESKIASQLADALQKRRELIEA